MSNATALHAVTLGADEKYEIAVSYGTILGTALLAIIVCLTKLYVRKFMLNSFGLDDWACLFGLCFVTAFNGIGIGVIRYGAGKHVEHVSQHDLAMWFRLYYICICMYLSISFAVKASILLTLRRVFSVPYIDYATKGLFIFFILFTISGSFIAAFQCNPPKYSYDLKYLMAPDRSQHCFSRMSSYAIFTYQAVVIFVCDIIMFLLPFPALLQLSLSRSKRIALIFVFGTGIVACIAPAIRFKSLNFYKTGGTDTTYEAASSLYWMAIEYNLGLTAGSLPALRPIFRKVGLFMTSKADSVPSKKENFTPSYQLEDTEPNNSTAGFLHVDRVSAGPSSKFMGARYSDEDRLKQEAFAV